MIYYVYILLCADGSYYTGVTNDLDRRLSEHYSGDDKKAYTYSRRPLKLVFYETFNDIHLAIACEKQIKGWSRKKKECLINDNFDRIKELSECKNESHHRNHEPFDSAQGDKVKETQGTT
ncbi:MAG: GIY-YIG nuclease family protein [Flavobacteriales bacterium]|nr:GIY-YIG nuclease family protein [Flavobacteriales bacterium]